MCINGYIKMCKRTQKDMIFCHLFDDKQNELERICVCQRYCPVDQKYVENKQERCNNYER